MPDSVSGDDIFPETGGRNVQTQGYKDSIACVDPAVGVEPFCR